MFQVFSVKSFTDSTKWQFYYNVKHVPYIVMRKLQPIIAQAKYSAC